MKKNDPKAETNDNNYIFLSFVTKYLPQGLVGLLIAIIFLASMGSTASALNSLASTTVVDIYKRLITKEGTDKHYLQASRWATIGWGLFCLSMALFASEVGNLIEAVNILGSLFYGTILGIFIVAFYMKRIEATATFWAAVISEIVIIGIWLLNVMAFLWLNLIGCLLVVFLAYCIQKVAAKGADTPSAA
jgi:Na+/proline symporter